MRAICNRVVLVFSLRAISVNLNSICRGMWVLRVHEALHNKLRARKRGEGKERKKRNNMKMSCLSVSDVAPVLERARPPSTE